MDPDGIIRQLPLIFPANSLAVYRTAWIHVKSVEATARVNGPGKQHRPPRLLKLGCVKEAKPQLCFPLAPLPYLPSGRLLRTRDKRSVSVPVVCELRKYPS